MKEKSFTPNHAADLVFTDSSKPLCTTNIYFLQEEDIGKFWDVLAIDVVNGEFHTLYLVDSTDGQVSLHPIGTHGVSAFRHELEYIVQQWLSRPYRREDDENGRFYYVGRVESPNQAGVNPGEEESTAVEESPTTSLKYIEVDGHKYIGQLGAVGAKDLWLVFDVHPNGTPRNRYVLDTDNNVKVLGPVPI